MGGFRRVNISVRRQLAKYRANFRYVLRLNKPWLLARTAGNYLRYTITRRPPLRAIDLAVTTACNLACEHCAVARLTPSRFNMLPEDYRRLGDELARNGVLSVQLTGGEPLLRPDLEQIIAALRPQRFFISLITNGLLATRQRLAGLRRVGLDNVCISMDDWHAVEHDRLRDRQGVHEQAVDCIDRALGLGLSVMLFTVATHQNVRGEGLLRLIELAAQKRVLLSIGWAVPVGRWSDHEEVLLTDDDLAYLQQIHENHLHVRSDFEANYFHFGCGAVKERLYLTTAGDVIPCPFLHLRLGNVFEEPLANIRQRALEIPVFQDYRRLCPAANDPQFRTSHLEPVRMSASVPISLADAHLVPAEHGQ